MSRGLGRKDGLSGLPTPLVVLSAGGMPSTLLLLPIPCFCYRLFKSGSWVFLVSLYLLGPEFAPTAHARSYFLSHIVSLYFVAQGEVYPGASTAAKGPRSQPVSSRVVSVSKMYPGDFPGGPVVKNPPSNAGDAGSIPR